MRPPQSAWPAASSRRARLRWPHRRAATIGESAVPVPRRPPGLARIPARVAPLARVLLQPREERLHAPVTRVPEVNQRLPPVRPLQAAPGHEPPGEVLEQRLSPSPSSGIPEIQPSLTVGLEVQGKRVDALAPAGTCGDAWRRASERDQPRVRGRVGHGQERALLVLAGPADGRMTDGPIRSVTSPRCDVARPPSAPAGSTACPSHVRPP